ncbi:MAG: NAD-dependent epimerase/dehydratase family protein, partial [Bacteroidales bacterium]|nr:NAD-dependent epimerase/dehydratase family protein [Bacteroidales bacterium]
YIIVTGANGYLGYYVCRQLVMNGFQVIALKYDHFASRIIEHKNIEYHH